MKKYTLAILLGALILFVSCDEDEPKIDPIVGLWELDRVEISDVPSGFASLEGSGSTAYGEDSYTIEFFSDFTYEREIDNIPDFGDIDDEGEWSIDGDELELDPEDEVGGLTYSFTIDEEIDDRELIVSSLTTFQTYSDQFQADWEANFDTISFDANGDALYPEILNAVLEENFQSVQVKLTLEFDRQ